MVTYFIRENPIKIALRIKYARVRPTERAKIRYRICQPFWLFLDPGNATYWQFMDPEIANTWQFMGSETAVYWRFMGPTTFRSQNG